MKTIKWLPEAEDDLKRLVEFLQEKNPKAAARAARTILDGANLLLTSPRLGRTMPDKTQRRELIIPFASGAYILRYMLDPDETPVIIRAWHNREQREEG
jgi:plasmid stabilization system protein ParE